MRKIFTPRQIYTATFLSGPLSGIYLIRKNFRELENPVKAQAATVIGVLLFLVFSLSLPFIPEWVPQIAIPLVLAVVSWQIAEKMQMDKEDIEVSEHHDFGSNWHIFWTIIISLILTLALLVGVIIIYEHLGILSLA